jgi:hypothetical protein
MQHQQKLNNLSFEEICLEKYKFILDGGLRDPGDDIGQLDPMSYPFVAQINKLGFITIDSQDAIDCTKYGFHLGSIERPYISGFIQTSKLKEFRRNIKTKTSLMFVTHVISDFKYEDEPENQTRIPVTQYTKSFAAGLSNEETFTSVPIFVSNENFNFDMEILGLPKILEMSHITVIDLRVNYPAHCEDGLFQEVIKCLNT